MASLSFSYRSTKPKAFLEMRFAYRVDKNDNPISFYTRSEIEVEKSYWKNEHKKKSNDPITQMQQNEINAKMTDLRLLVLDKFNKMDIENISKEWFLNVVDEYYHPKDEAEKPAEIIPNYLVDYISYFLKNREDEMKSTSVTKYNVIKKKLQRMEASLDMRFEIKDVNENFKKQFKTYYEGQRYSQNTMHRELGFIKTVCRHARTKDVETSKDLDLLKFTKDPVKHIYFSEDELQKLENLKGLAPHLENARDWLVISCHCGQRISDFLRFNKDMITEKQGVKLINFTQKKTGKPMSIALSSKIVKILEKRKGDFPHSISDQRYNDYIKIVCEKAGFNEMMKGKKQENISKDKKNKVKKMRAITGIFPKHELVTSHIGRRTFATLKRNSMPLSLLMSMTGHTTETALNTYLQMEEEDKAVEAFKYL